MEVLAGSGSSSVTPAQRRNNHMRGGSAIEVHDIIAASQKYSKKIGHPYIPGLNKPKEFTIQKNKNRDFISTVQNSVAQKLSPSHYQIFDADGFIST